MMTVWMKTSTPTPPAVYSSSLTQLNSFSGLVLR